MAVRIDDLSISCRNFEADHPIPPEHAVEGVNTAVDLDITGVPGDAVELAVICHDPDAPMPDGFTHWTVYGLPPETRTVDSDSGRQGPNSLGKTGYTGPNPPAGHGLHRYYFWVYALDTPVDGTPDREDFLARYGPHVLEQNRVVGTYSR